MKLKLLFPTVFALMLSAACTSITTSTPRIDLLGDPASPSAAARTIVITPDTKYVNVTGGETVRFVVGDKTFAWTFNVARTIMSFDLNQIAPPGVLDHKVTVYVAPNPLYIDGWGHGGHGGHGGHHR